MIPLIFAALPLLQQEVARPLPVLTNGMVVSGPGVFRQDGPLRIEGDVRLENMTLMISGPITVVKGARLELKLVHLLVSDPPNSANGSSNLHCEGAADIVITDSTMEPKGGAHPIWVLEGRLKVVNFQTENSEFHLERTEGDITNFKIFELEISRSSRVRAKHLRLVFLSTHSGDHEKLQFDRIPVDRPFAQTLNMGSGAQADLEDVQIQFFLLYLHGESEAALRHIGRAQLAFFPDCQGRFTLSRGVLGSREPAVIPEAGASNCRFKFTLEDVNVDTWDVYARGKSDLTFEGSYIDELTANGDAKLSVRNSTVYADWMAVADNAQVAVDGGTVGALSVAKERPDLATSQIRLSGSSHAAFSGVKFDCGIVVTDRATVQVDHPVVAPQYIHRFDKSKIMN
ncbi:MAG: hypothetical protein JSS69_10430 [Acidobacteria bacterium]|nr:hypothetical protein [Acidobacteriota bacterium]MBS1866320.1 hypothetical protein [Acidobacteriota bacterium]